MAINYGNYGNCGNYGNYSNYANYRSKDGDKIQSGYKVFFDSFPKLQYFEEILLVLRSLFLQEG